jgi:hypothetical protein
MKVILHHINKVKEKPHHVRRQVAFSAALVVTGAIALVWFALLASSGTFALGDANFADSVTATTPEVVEPTPAGLAAVASGVEPSEPAHIEIVDSESKRQTKQAEPTIVPF